MKQFLFTVFILFVVLLQFVNAQENQIDLIADDPAKVVNCTPADAEARLVDVVLIPDPPTTGTNHIYTTADLLEQVTAATYDLQIYLGGTSIMKRTASACGNDSFELPLHLGSVQITGFTCPVGPSEETVDIELVLLSNALMVKKLKLPSPDVSVTVDFSSFDQNNNPLVCVQVIVD